ncbi:MAG: hypothetical protein LAT51_12645 [Flavobacteriaceae bacterium]|nr:hypothetical protein [Flavobacteriaceae bacterium]
MNFQEVLDQKYLGDTFLTEKNIEEKWNLICIDGLAPIPIIPSSSYDRSNNISVSYPSKIDIGKILFLQGESVEDYDALLDEQRICFYKDHTGPITQSEYTFKNDYLLLKSRYLTNYLKKYKKTAPIWGSFFHFDLKPSINWEIKSSPETLTAIDDLRIDNELYFDNLFLSVTEPNPFTRFLKLYHLLELQFDIHTAELIRALLDSGNKEREISSKLRDYANKDLNRLQSLLKERCSDLESLCNKLNIIESFETKAIEIFYISGRQSNPLKKSDFLSVIELEEKFKKSNIDSLGGYNFQTLIPKLTAYWIYRIRSSIAHNKFGEYIMDTDDEDFIVNFAEPLLKEAVKQCFSK